MENLLNNGDMEQGWEYQSDKYGNLLRTVKKPLWWTAFWYNDMPEYKPAEADAHPDRVHSGKYAAQWFLNYKTPNGGLRQTVSKLEPGKAYVVGGWGQTWTRYKNGKPVPCSLELRVDPYGGTDPEDPRCLRGDPSTDTNNKWIKLSTIAFEAKSDRCTVFVIGIFADPGQDMNAYIDDMYLSKIDVQEPEYPPVSSELSYFEQMVLDRLDDILHEMRQSWTLSRE